MANFTQISLLLVLMCWTTDSTGAAFSFEEEFLLMKENYIQMKEIVKNLEEKVTQLESKDVEMQEKLTQLESKVKEQDSLLREKNDSRMNQLALAVNGLPSSCGDLKMIGHTLNGFYDVMGSTMMESVYCDFTKPTSDAGFEKWIGFTDVKSAPLNFYVQRNYSFSATGTAIPFHLSVVNEGNAMDLESGTFTAPRPGTYFFSFTGSVNFPYSTSSVYLDVRLYLNGDLTGMGTVQEANTPPAPYHMSPLTFQLTLNLKKGDQIWLQMSGTSGASLGDGSGHWTHFTGFMLDEDIAASLT